MADRERLKAQFNGQYVLGSSGYIGLMLQQAQDDYDDTEYGLKDVDRSLYTLSFGATPLRTLTYSLHAGIQQYEYDQVSTSRGDEWTLLTDNQSLVAGMDIGWEALENQLQLNLAYRYTQSTGELSQTNTAATAADPVIPLPDLDTRIHTVELEAEYFLDLQTTLIARAVYEDYEADNWSFDGIGPIANDGRRDYLTGGMSTPNHHAALIELGVRYQC
ncbi:MtrB/PioB family outer membrane beta-barrel protein [Motiliproteus sp. SC1-56]|uniref:MtrB/PioB family outer membrane beta-barrel protein n=1 Tax=Motiliproteus sp. SC1-56 TaxID=2799565 RepID=UPI001A90235F|nr:MtrB/PioB family outer membrane beta-barrel protein [Motiliproteus sp. SC1-56]